MAILCILLLASTSLAIIFFAKYRANIAKPASTNMTFYTKDDLDASANTAKSEMLADIKSQLGGGKSVYSMLRQMYPENIIYVDKNQYVFAEINKNLAMNNFNDDNFATDDNGFITYSENSQVVSHKGIDVSKFQGDIDWAKVKESGVEFAFIRAGYRTYGTGIITPDTSLEANLQGANDNNIPAGVYFFSQAITMEEINEEADFVLEAIKDYKITCPIVIDVEEIAGDTYRQQDLTPEELTDLTVAFCEKIKNAGYTPMIYANTKGFIGKLDMTKLESYEKWFAYYGDYPYLPYQMSLWQYSESGTIDGIPNKVDLNISFKTWG